MEDKYRRQKAYVQRIKNDPVKWEHHKAMRNKRRQKMMEKMRLENGEKLKNHREKEKLRVREYRARHRIVLMQGNYTWGINRQSKKNLTT